MVTYCPREKQGNVCSSLSQINQLKIIKPSILYQGFQCKISCSINTPEKKGAKILSYRESKNCYREAALLIVMGDKRRNLTTNYPKQWIRFTCIYRQSLPRISHVIHIEGE